MLDPEIAAHYELGLESARLAADSLELVRSRELLLRFLPRPPCSVLDVGGGPGVYSEWLSQRGYVVHLVDPVARHIEEARGRANGRFTSELGDARALQAVDASHDAVLLMGPLYHLLDRVERVRALAEARRVVRPRGVVVAVAISRFASLLDGLRSGWLADPRFRRMVEEDLATGRHRNPAPEERPEWFTNAYLHHPDELRAEATDAGLVVEVLVPIEGPGWLFSGDPNRRELALQVVRSVETEESLLGASSHLMAICRPS